VFQVCEKEKKYELIEQLIAKYPNDLTMIKSMIVTSSPSVLKYLLKMKPIKDERIAQIFVNSLSTTMYDSLAASQLKELAAKFYVFTTQNKFKFVSEISEKLIDKIIKSGIQLEENTMYKWLFNHRNAGSQFFDNMQ